MHKFLGLPMVAAIAAIPSTALAENETGDIQIKVFGSYVAVDGEVTEIRTDLIGLPANTQTAADDNFTPTLAIEYFASPNISLETICCFTQHDVDGRAGLAGAELVSNANVIPATLIMKYHLAPAAAVRPYIGAGPSYFIFVDEKPGATTVALGADRQQIDDKFGLALQAGLDIPVSDNGMAVSLDAKRYFLRTTARWFANDTEVLATRHRLDPWVVSAGVAFRF